MASHRGRSLLAASAAAILVAGVSALAYGGVTATTASAVRQSVTRAAPSRAVPETAPHRLTLPAPTGPRPVGTVSLHLVDPTRSDPWARPQRMRELMISLTYPARDVRRYPLAPWLPSRAAAQFLTENGLDHSGIQLPLTHERDGAPVDRRGGRLPVVLVSPGKNADRSSQTLITEELASRGYLVVTIDYTFDAAEVEFPDGRVVRAIPDAVRGDGSAIAAARVVDTRFVLDRLAVVNAGGDPDAEHRRLPAGLRGAADLRRVAMAGTSLGGGTTAATMFEDRRIKAGLSLDGAVYGPVITAGLDRPYFLMDAVKSSRQLPEIAAFWSRLRGWRLNAALRGAAHVSYGDDEVLIPQIGRLLGWTPQQIAAEIGTIDPRRAVAVQRAYPLAFFDLTLRHRGHLLDGPSPRFPEVTFIP